MEGNIVLKERTHSINNIWNFIFYECLWIKIRQLANYVCVWVYGSLVPFLIPAVFKCSNFLFTYLLVLVLKWTALTACADLVIFCKGSSIKDLCITSAKIDPLVRFCQQWVSSPTLLCRCPQCRIIRRKSRIIWGSFFHQSWGRLLWGSANLPPVSN